MMRDPLSYRGSSAFQPIQDRSVSGACRQPATVGGALPLIVARRGAATAHDGPHIDDPVTLSDVIAIVNVRTHVERGAIHALAEPSTLISPTRRRSGAAR